MTVGSSSLAARHLDALYERDGTTLIRVRSTDVATPRVHLLRTPEGNHWLISAAVSPPLRARLDALFAAEPVLPLDAYESTPPESIEVVRRLLDGGSGEYRGPAFAFPAGSDAPSHAPPEYVIGVFKPPAPLVAAPDLEWIAEAKPHEQPLVVARAAGGRVVAVCHSARLSDAAAAARLEVANEARRRGLGVAVTARWAAEVRAGGRVPLYSTTWENVASRGVVRRLGLEAYAEDWHLD